MLIGLLPHCYHEFCHNLSLWLLLEPVTNNAKLNFINILRNQKNYDVRQRCKNDHSCWHIPHQIENMDNQSNLENNSEKMEMIEKYKNCGITHKKS